jgi:hypothetical protein
MERATMRRKKPVSGTASVIGFLGLVLIVLGVGILSFDAMRAFDTGQWRSKSMVDLFTTGAVARVLPDVGGWLEHPRSFRSVQPHVVFVLGSLPQWAFCLGLGGLIVWRALT